MLNTMTVACEYHVCGGGEGLHVHVMCAGGGLNVMCAGGGGLHDGFKMHENRMSVKWRKS